MLFATDFTKEAQAAAPYAISMAQENQARLVLLHVMPDPDSKMRKRTPQDSVANVMHQLYELIPPEAEPWCRLEATVRFGNPAERILEATMEIEADLSCWQSAIVVVNTPLQFSDADEIESADQRSVFLGSFISLSPGRESPPSNSQARSIQLEHTLSMEPVSAYTTACGDWDFLNLRVPNTFRSR